jgi:hypothetical protein
MAKKTKTTASKKGEQAQTAKQKVSALKLARLEATDVSGNAPESPAGAPEAKPAAKKAKAAKPERMSALEAAAKILTDAGTPMNAKEMIEAMAAKGYWTNSGGKTPHATLYAAIAKEIAVKGKEARFRKSSKGHFTAK